MIIRRAVEADLDQLLVLVEAFCAADQHPFDRERVTPALAPLLQDDSLGVVHVLELDGLLEGYGVLTWGWSLESGGRESLIDELYVREQGQGRGSALLTALLDAARAHGARAVFLETESHNARVREFYARHGFGVEPSTWMSRSLVTD